MHRVGAGSSARCGAARGDATPARPCTRRSHPHPAPRGDRHGDVVRAIRRHGHTRVRCSRPEMLEVESFGRGVTMTMRPASSSSAQPACAIFRGCQDAEHRSRTSSSDREVVARRGRASLALPAPSPPARTDGDPLVGCMDGARFDGVIPPVWEPTSSPTGRGPSYRERSRTSRGTRG